MTQEDKELLLKDLCARLPYNVIGKFDQPFAKLTFEKQLTADDIPSIFSGLSFFIPYLRRLSSMTEEEKEEYSSIVFKHEFYNGDEENILYYDDFDYLMDWLNKHHFDYRGLIDKGLAIEVTEDNNPYKD